MQGEEGVLRWGLEGTIGGFLFIISAGMLVTPSVTPSTFGIFGFLVFIFLPVLLGWKAYRLSKVM